MISSVSCRDEAKHNGVPDIPALMPIPRAVDQPGLSDLSGTKDIPWLSEIRHPDIAHPASCGIVASISNAWFPFCPGNTLDLSKFLFQNLPIKNRIVLKARLRVDAETLRCPVRFYRADASQLEPTCFLF